ncbi:helix-turn-helix domain-containing protein [Kribbella speibonae]|uniref:Helix-turn-helix domain-containing protein n=1 Tax=Kribbella speibonae TaxID=1572660 RepID=A0ABY2AEM3_9ACTN|nr:helix-turn-helix domain-containing protein [Kribbella speibonae]TCC28117.1 helix-turn-helix domain-containing protein [Kribbella speibonae]
MLPELSVQEQKYQAVLAVLSDGRSVSEVAEQWGVSRQSVHAWLRRYEDEGLAGLAPRSRRPASCPRRMPAEVTCGWSSCATRIRRGTGPLVVPT